MPSQLIEREGSIWLTKESLRWTWRAKNVENTKFGVQGVTDPTSSKSRYTPDKEKQHNSDLGIGKSHLQHHNFQQKHMIREFLPSVIKMIKQVCFRHFNIIDITKHYSKSAILHNKAYLSLAEEKVP